MEILVLNKQGMGIRKIAKMLGISRNTVRRYLRQGTLGSYKQRPSVPSILDPYKSYIVERLETAKHYIIPATVIHREIREKGYRGGTTLVRDFIRAIRSPKPLDPVVRFETSPGQQMQVDWTVIRGGNKRLLAFAAIMGYSRIAYVQFSNVDDEETLLRCHMNAFEYFGGVPKEILYDNMKTVVIERDYYKPGSHRFQKTFIDFAKHFGFIPRLCRPYRAKTKGKVERFIGYLKKGFYIPYITKLGLDRPPDVPTLNSEVKKWLHDIADKRLIRELRTSPSDRKSEELAALQGLPCPYPISNNVPIDHNVAVEQRDLSIYEKVAEGIA